MLCAEVPSPFSKKLKEKPEKPPYEGQRERAPTLAHSPS